MLMEPIAAGTKLVDYAAGQNDRWLMLALLAVGLGVLWLVARYFVRQHEGLLADHKAQREEYMVTLRELVGKQATMLGTLQGCLDRNSQALEEHRETVQWCRGRKL